MLFRLYMIFAVCRNPAGSVHRYLPMWQRLFSQSVFALKSRGFPQSPAFLFYMLSHIWIGAAYYENRTRAFRRTPLFCFHRVGIKRVPEGSPCSCRCQASGFVCSGGMEDICVPLRASFLSISMPIDRIKRHMLCSRH